MKKYVSTRGNQKPLSFCEAIVQGIADDNGLLVPNFPLPILNLDELKNLNYKDLATKILGVFVDDENLKNVELACENAYDSGLFSKEVVPVKKISNLYIGELFHGPTAAFKDMALTILPHLLTFSLKSLKQEKEVIILTATSGDTGKAALEGFKDVKGTQIKVFYPLDGVSYIQQMQMITQEGNNVEVIGINGNFDDAQTGVKEAFSSTQLSKLCDKNDIILSSANSINIGRLIPQIVYYFYTYFNLLKTGEMQPTEKVNFCVPSGNFGNALAGFISKKMGLPINKIICASNKNNILTDFFTSGTYNANREFYKTNAPAMDILVSSNLERLLWFISDGKRVDDYMKSLKDTGEYTINKDLFNRISTEFDAGTLKEDEVINTIKSCYDETSYLLDTHTAVGYGVYQNYRKRTNDQTKTILLSTASPYKFPESVLYALTKEELSATEAIDTLNSITKIEVPTSLQNITNKEILHNIKIDKNNITEYIINKCTQ